MLTKEEQIKNVMELIPFTPISQTRLSVALKEEMNDQDLFLILSGLVQEGKIKMNMGTKGPEYYRIWNNKIDEERKALSKDMNSLMGENVFFFPRFDGYVANIKDNFCNDSFQYALSCYNQINNEYVLWHKNNKTGVVYPPKLNAVNSADALAINIISGLGVDESQVTYALEFESLVPEPLRDRPEEISAPKAFFAAEINYEDSVDFVQTRLLEQFYQPTRPGLWAFQYGERFLFNDEESKAAIRDYAKKVGSVYFDLTDLLKTITAVYSDILATPEEYQNKKVNILYIAYNLKDDLKYENLKEFNKEYLLEAKRIEEKTNELFQKLHLPEGVSLEYQFLTLGEVAENLTEDVKEYLKKRYLNL